MNDVHAQRFEFVFRDGQLFHQCPVFLTFRIVESVGKMVKRDANFMVVFFSQNVDLSLPNVSALGKVITI